MSKDSAVPLRIFYGVYALYLHILHKNYDGDIKNMMVT